MLWVVLQWMSVSVTHVVVCLCAESESGADTVTGEVIMDTEAWVWGDNQKGQLGLGDTLNRFMVIMNE